MKRQPVNQEMKTPRNSIHICLPLAMLFLQCQIQSATAASWTLDVPMNTVCYSHTTTLLTDGRLLVAGGRSYAGGNLTNAELFNPGSGIWTNTGSLHAKRSAHTATLLQNGQVLVAGGNYEATTSFLASAELYNPATGQWTNTGSLATGRGFHTATLLLNGQVLVAGGFDGTNYLNSAEIFDPAAGQWASTTPMNQGRSHHTATLLADGTVMVIGGYTGTNSLISAEVFNPATKVWSSLNPMNLDRSYHTATRLMDDTVLVVGGSGSNSTATAMSAEVYNPASGAWTLTGSTTASLLPNGWVMVCGGTGGKRVGLYDPVAATWTTNTAWMNVSRQGHTATMLPGGRVLVIGGATSANFAETYDYYTSGAWTTNSVASRVSYSSTMTLLTNGLVLVAGGSVSTGADSYQAFADAQIFNPVSGSWTAIAPMNYPRASHSATLLSNGNVLLVGGYESVTNNNVVSCPPVSEIYIPSSGQWLLASNTIYPRNGHIATLLPNGKVLVTGGSSTNAELYDPNTGAWKLTGSSTNVSYWGTATLLPTGKVLFTGANGSPSTLTRIYDPASETWTTNASMKTSRTGHTATLLPSGKVLVAGGLTSYASTFSTTSAEIYDVATGTWTTISPMNIGRLRHEAVLLSNGKILVAGGYYAYPPYSYDIQSAELYDPATATWTITGSLNLQRYGNVGALLPDGRFLVVGGTNNTTAEIYDPGLGYTNTVRPQITAITPAINLGSSLTVTGALFRGVSESSGGNNAQGSSTDYPLVQLRSIESGQTVFLPATNWGTNSFTSMPITGFPPGYALATVFVNGIQSTSSIVNIGVQAPTLCELKKLTNGAFRFSLNYYAGAVFTVQMTISDLSTPLSNWSSLGKMTEVSPGIYQYTDSIAKFNSKSFYSAHSQ
jgi:N-acetylneuraminic acid mutarotase